MPSLCPASRHGAAQGALWSLVTGGGEGKAQKTCV